MPEHECYSSKPIRLGGSSAICDTCGGKTMNIVPPKPKKARKPRKKKPEEAPEAPEE